MASALSHHHLYVHTFHYHRPSYRHRHCSGYKEPLKRSANFSARQSPEKHSIRGRNHDLPPSSSSSPLRRLREAFKIDGISLDILSIALPAALALAADPLTSLVDSAFVGHLGAVELAAVGVSVSVFNLVSKLVNVPLLNITTSFVAEERALISKGISVSSQIGQDADVGGQRKEVKELLPSVSTSLVLAAGIGFVQAVALYLGSGSIMNILGISVDSPIRVPAEQFLSVRAFGAPPIVVALAAQGTFRGSKDTKTPLYAIGSGNILNVVLDPILIFLLGFGITGAATATVISEYLIAFILLLELGGTFSFTAPNIDGGRLLQYLRAGGLLIARTVAVLLIMTLATSVAATQGPTQMAGHQICLGVWMAISLLTDALALALAGQALLADGYSQGNNEQARQVVFRVLQIGLLTGTGLAVVLFLGFGTFSTLFTTDPEVLRVAMSGLLFVAGSQPVTAIAFVLDGLYYGVSDFGYATYAMVISSLLASLFMVLATPSLGLPGVWTSLFLFMSFRVAAGAWRLSSKTGPWKEIWSDSD